ncbi:PfkB family carbohydrate kinase [Microbacterium sp. SS28]|uniref:PfkB family carbohydrate kinase n=1 Tax=Microbacterium sp. SS28 TaxID=2919948 RepID=UPI0035B49CF0
MSLALDTTGAGDSFNGAYLASRLAGIDPLKSARLGNSVAGEVVAQPGAIIPVAAMPPLSEEI